MESSNLTDKAYIPELEDPDAAAEYAFDATSGGLGGGADIDACVATVAKIGERYDATLERVPTACRAGCSWCCHFGVELLPHEAITLFRYISTRIEPEERAVCCLVQSLCPIHGAGRLLSQCASQLCAA